MRPKETTQQLEWRRRKAMTLLKQGLGVRQTARQVGASAATVTQWRQAYETHGEKALQARLRLASRDTR